MLTCADGLRMKLPDVDFADDTDRWAPAIPSWQYEALFALLDQCGHAENLPEFKQILMESLGEILRYPNTTFLAGATYSEIFVDRNPVTAGRMTAVLEEYQERWHTQDIFRLPAPAKTLTHRSVLTHTQIGQIPADTKVYLSDFLYRHNLYSATAMHLRLANNGHALVGIFDSADMEPAPSDLRLLSLAARQLSVLARTLPSGGDDAWSTRLTPRQRQVGDLIATGMTNEEISRELGISLDAAKKHVSRIFERLQIRNRAELVRQHHLYATH